MNILITAIGSMSAACAISKLKENQHFVVGCDIYPGEWHSETYLCDLFYQAPYATDKQQYIEFLLNICKKHNIDCLIPLTDLEIDVINEYREQFKTEKVTLCMQSEEVLKVARNKYTLFKTFEVDEYVPSIATRLLSDSSEEISFPCVAKPYDGRSSEGLVYIQTEDQLAAIKNKNRYIIQEKIDGPIYTVDYIRSSLDGADMAIPRVELLRTKNGAGLTVQIKNNLELQQLVSHIGKKLGINGCVNMEFIEHDNNYYLIDINPRFSAGVAFSVLSGYDMINNHVKCFCQEQIDESILYKEKILIKKYQEFEYKPRC